MRGSVFAIGVAVAVALIARAIMIPADPERDQGHNESSAKSSSRRVALSEKEVNKPEELQHDLTKRSQTTQKLPAGLAEEFSQYIMRALDPFETEAVPRVIAGSQSEYSREGQQLQVVSAIRSEDKCN